MLLGICSTGLVYWSVRLQHWRQRCNSWTDGKVAFDLSSLLVAGIAPERPASGRLVHCPRFGQSVVIAVGSGSVARAGQRTKSWQEASSWPYPFTEYLIMCHLQGLLNGGDQV